MASNDYEIIYDYDMLCSWCYAFEPVVKKIYDKYHDQMAFRVVNGGMASGPNKGRIKDWMGGEANFNLNQLRAGYAPVSQRGGVPITDAYLEGLVARDNYLVDSDRPGRGEIAYRSHAKNAGDELDYIFKFQTHVYRDGMNPNEPPIYELTASDFNLDPQAFLAQMELPQTEADLQSDYTYSRSLGVNSYPQLFLRVGDQYYLISKGFSDYDTVDKRIQTVLEQSRASTA